tara:strand:- start:1185 stop:1523 length:339 start_codon:yes stop_codon:yes gene_type:complete
MASLFTKVKLYLEDNSKTFESEINNIHLQNDGDGDYIHTWSVDGLDKPTDEQLDSYETAGNTAETNAGIDATRRSQYGSWESQMEMIYKDQKNGTTTFKDHCDKVRSDNPKE